MMEPESLLMTCRRLAIEAGKAVMDVYDSGDFDAAVKADQSPVTAADLASDKIISDGLKAAFPDIALVTEEQAATHAGTAPDRFFIIDPLDGTKEFLHRRGDFTVNIALVENGVPVFGVVYAPARERLFWSHPDGGAFEETPPFDPDRIGETRRLSVTASCDGGLTVVASKSHRDQATDDYIGQYDVADFTSAGSSLKFCLVAAGEADLYPRLGRTMEWDTAAGDAVLRAAGGRVVAFDDHSTFAYGKPGYANGFFIACAPHVALKPAVGA